VHAGSLGSMTGTSKCSSYVAKPPKGMTLHFRGIVEQGNGDFSSNVRHI